MAHPLLVFIPAKNEAATIQHVIQDVRFAFAQEAAELTILVIDDGSSDTTQQLAETAGAIVIRHPTSQGLGRTFAEAHQYALQRAFSVLLTIDGDRQFDAKDLYSIYLRMRDESLDFVSGSRFLPGSSARNIPPIKRRGNIWLAKLVTSITRRTVTDSTCGLRGYSRKALEALHTFSAFTYTHEVLLNLALKPVRFGEVAINVEYYPERISRIAHDLGQYGRKTLIILLKSLLLYQPARLFSALSFPFFLIGVPSVSLLGLRFLLTGEVSPYKSIGIFGLVCTVVALMLVVSGVLLQMLAWVQTTLEQILYEQRTRHRSERH